MKGLKDISMTVLSQSISEDSAEDLKKVAKGVGTSLIGGVIGRTLWFLCQVLIARSFGAEVFGLYVLGLIVLRIAGLIARFGLHTGTMRFVSIYRKNDQGRTKGVLIAAFLIPLLNGVILGTFVYVFADFISTSIFHKPQLEGIIKIFAMCVPLMATMMVVAGTSRGFHKTKYFVYIKDICQPLANISFVFISVLLDLDMHALMWAFVMSHAVGLFVGIFFIYKEFPALSNMEVKAIYETKELITYSAPLLFSGFLLFLIYWTNAIILGLMKTSVDVGVFRAASQIPILLTLILLASNSIYAPAIAEMYHQGHRERLEMIFKATTRWVFLLVLPASLVLIFSAKEIMLIFGHAFVKIGAPVLIILTISQFINCLTGGVAVTLNMTGKQNLEMINSATLVLMNIGLNCLLIPRYGSIGAAIATGTSICIINILRLLEVYVLYKIHPYNMGYIQGITSGVIATIVLSCLDGRFANYSDVVVVILNILVVGLIFIIMFVTVGIKDEDWLVINTVSRKCNTFLRHK